MGMMALKINIKKEESTEEPIETKAEAPEVTTDGAEASVEDVGTTDVDNEQILPATFNHESS